MAGNSTSKRSKSLSKEMIAQRILSARGSESQADFARKVGISQNAISQYERGERVPTPEVLAKFFTSCNISIEWILLGHGEIYYQEPHQMSPPGITSVAVDPIRLKAIILAVKEAIANCGFVVSLEKESEIISVIYDLAPINAPIQKGSITNLLNMIKI